MGSPNLFVNICYRSQYRSKRMSSASLNKSNCGGRLRLLGPWTLVTADIYCSPGWSPLVIGHCSWLGRSGKPSGDSRRA